MTITNEDRVLKNRTNDSWLDRENVVCIIVFDEVINFKAVYKFQKGRCQKI